MAERERYDRDLLELRGRIADREARADAVRKAQADEERAQWRRHHDEVAAKVAAQAAQRERSRRMVGYSNVEDTQTALCDALDRIAAIEASSLPSFTSLRREHWPEHGRVGDLGPADGRGPSACVGPRATHRRHGYLSRAQRRRADKRSCT